MNKQYKPTSFGAPNYRTRTKLTKENIKQIPKLTGKIAKTLAKKVFTPWSK